MFSLQNDEFCIKHDEFCILNGEFCIEHDDSLKADAHRYEDEMYPDQAPEDISINDLRKIGPFLAR